MEARGAKLINVYDISNKDSDLYPLVSPVKNKLIMSTIFVRIFPHLWSPPDSPWQCLFNALTDTDLFFCKRTIFIIGNINAAQKLE